jgi:hypothetical protein
MTLLPQGPLLPQTSAPTWREIPMPDPERFRKLQEGGVFSSAWAAEDAVLDFRSGGFSRLPVAIHLYGNVDQAYQATIGRIPEREEQILHFSDMLQLLRITFGSISMS